MVATLQSQRLPYVYAVLAPLAATVISYGVESVFPKGNISLVYLLAVLLVASRSSYKPALLCALLSFVLYNLFFTNPRLSLIMTHREDILTVLLFVVVALLVGHQAARLHTQVVSLKAQEKFLGLQLQFAQALGNALSADDVIERLQTTINTAFDGLIRAEVAPLPSDGAAGVRPAPGATDCYLLAFDRDSATGDRGLRLQLIGAHVPDQWPTMVDTLYQQAALAIARTQLAEQAQNERLRAEQEHLRSALLSSVSHDLKTPLAAMIGAASSLKDLSADLSEADKGDLLDSILEEARRLEGYIQNLLDMTRLGQGELQLHREWIGMEEIIHVVIKRASQVKGDRRIDVQLDKDLPLIYVHSALIEQALFNVLENAIKFAPPQSTIRIIVRRTENWLQTDIVDEGPGIPPEQREKIFDMFHSVSRGDYHQAGTGLGLAICQGMLGAHGGRAEVVDTEQGACIRIHLPLHYGSDAP